MVRRGLLIFPVSNIVVLINLKRRSQLISSAYITPDCTI